ncbi:hypothetical protein M5689_014429 [Euphorbia peplus]|nr:hypothetical protein M5689_014429 [Euphorbia peplus]
MEVAGSCCSIIVTSYSTPNTKILSTNSKFPALIRNGRLTTRRISAVNEVVVSSSGVTWQIVVGTLAGVTPFVVAGIEFNKRIVAQRRCEECGGSGLVLREKEYFRCPQCGGFLPWQSWKRFFSG